MPIPYQHKRSTAAGVEPTTLQDGEIAINVAAADPKIFFKDSANTVRAFSLASYASATHSHVVADVTDFTTKANVVSVNGITGAVVLTSTGVSAASASHSHVAANITDFATESAKYGPVTSVNSLTGTIVLTSLGVSAASAVHSHVAADITNFTSVANVVSVNAKTGVVSISHTDVTAASASHTHAASDITSGTLDAARLPLATTIAAGAVIVGTGLGVSSGTVSVTYGANSTSACRGDDSRLSDTRTPTDGSVTTAKIANDAVTYAKLQNVSATDRLLGRSSAGSGDVEEITCGSFGRSLIGSADAAAARSTLSVQPTASPAFTGAATVTNDGNVVPLTVTNTGTANSFVVNDASGDTTPFVIDAAGNVGIGLSSPDASTKLHLGGTYPTSGTVTRAILCNGLVPSGSTVFGDGLVSFIGTAAASFTCANLRHFVVAQGSIGAGSSVTNQFGYVAESSLTGATNNYGFYSDIASGTGRWNFYANGTAANYFAGNVGVGTTAPSNKLSVSNAGAEGLELIPAQNANESRIQSYNRASAAWNKFSINCSTFEVFCNGGTSAIAIATTAAVTLGGQLLVTAGSASACGVAFSGDVNTGLAQIGGADTASLVTAGVERVRCTSGGTVEVRANSGSISHGLAYNENGGEIVLYDETQTAATLIDQISTDTRVLELVNGSNLKLGLGSGNTTGVVSLMRAGYSESMRIKANGSVRFLPLTADPASPEAGDVYFNSSTSKLRVYTGTAWADLH